MYALLKPDYLSVEDYLFYEQDSPIRHEYVDGELFAMAGASDQHNEITGNLFAPLYQHLLDHECRPYANDMKIQAAQTVYYYPDVVVACDRPSTADPYYRREPVLIIEVTSPKTEAKDRREKLEAYKNIPSLKEYVIVGSGRIKSCKPV